MLSRLKQPFWAVTFFSGAWTIAALVINIYTYFQLQDWRYFTLAGITTLLLVAHLIAWWLATLTSRTALGIWLIALMQMLCAVLPSLVIADYWLIGAYLLILAPLSVALVDEVRRVPLAIVLSLFSAAGMIALDLLQVDGRVNVLHSIPGSETLVIVSSLVHITALLVLLWHFRLREGAAYPLKLDLATQQALVFTAISALSIVIVSSVLIEQIRQAQIAQVGQNFQTLAQINAQQVRSVLEQQVNALLSFAVQEENLRTSLAAANASYSESVPAQRQQLAEREWLWRNSRPNSNFVLGFRNNPQTVAMSSFRSTNLLHQNLLLTDAYGGLVASQGEHPPRYYYGAEDWWQQAWNDGLGGVYIGNLDIGPNTHQGSIRIAVGVLNPQTNQTVGVISSNFSLRGIQNDIIDASSSAQGDVFLFATNGVVIASPEEEVGSIGKMGPISRAFLRVRRELGVISEPGWLLSSDTSGEELVTSYAPVAGRSLGQLDPLSDLSWSVVVEDTRANALAEVTRSTQVATLSGFLIMALMVMFANVMVRVIVRPIEGLTNTAAAMSAGNLNQHAEPVGPVELVTLAEAFNSLTERLRSLINNLQDQVAQRTAQLETRVKQLATLNRITQTLSSVNELHAVLYTVSKELALVLNTQSCGIAMLNREQTELRVIVEYEGYENHDSAVGLLIPFHEGTISHRVLTTGETVVVSQPELRLLTDSIDDVVSERQPQSLIIVPLQIRGVILGTIGVTLYEEGRQFTPAEVELVNTAAAQVAGAIEGAQLFEKERTAREAAETLRAATQTLSTSLDTGEVFERILHELRKVVPYDSASLQQLKEERLVIIDGIGFQNETLEKLIGTTFDPNDQGIPNGKVMQSRQPLIIDDMSADYAAFYHNTPNETSRTRSWMGVPMLFGDQPIGMLTLDKHEPGFYTEQHARLAAAISAQAATAIANAMLFEEMRKAREAAEAANVAKSTFLANMSHELRTPLNAILGFAQVMERDTSLSPTQREHLAIILRSGSHLLGLINDVLEMSKIEAGRITLNTGIFDLWKLLQGVEEMIRLRADAKDITLGFEVSSNIPQFVVGDESKIRQVLINLLGNAVKFTHHGGVILRASVEDAFSITDELENPITRNLESSDAVPVGQNGFCWLHFEVEDTGEGIAADQLSQLFQAFVQTSSGKKAREGTGLGLVISHQFVQLMGGEITVESELGQGSLFQFDIRLGLTEPLAGVIAQPDSRRVAGISGADPADLRVLVVDDKLENRLLLVNWLQAVGFQVAEAANGREALECHATWKPHLVWMDIRMPVMNGYEASERIKSSLHGQETIVIALTASAFEHERAAVLAVGCDDFVRKPVLETTFFETMAQHLNFALLYAEPDPSRPDGQVIAVELPTAAALANLPAEWLDRLQEAAWVGDAEMANGVIEQIRQSEPQLALGLQQLIANYRFDTIESLVQEVTTANPKAKGLASKD